MASAKQIAANQANSKKSTGPRTLEGKQAVRLNATTHGLSGQTLLRTKEEEATYSAYSVRLLRDLAPKNDIELDFAERIVFDSWRVRRAGTIEQNLFALSDADFETGDASEEDALNQAAAFEQHQKTINLLSLYQQRLERGIHKNLEALRKMQKERKAEQAKPQRPIQSIDNPAAKRTNGFVSSTPPQPAAPSPTSTLSTPENMAA